MTKPVIIIAECGVNHNGDMALAKKMIDVARAAGADFVKFQTYSTDALVKKDAPMAAYQKKNLGQAKSQHAMLKAYELSHDQFRELHAYAKKKGIAFLSTPFDPVSLSFLHSLGLKQVKFSSGDLTNGPLLLQAAKLKLSVILSTGMATMEEIRDALLVLRRGYKSKGNARFSDLRGRVSILHCVSEYPAPAERINLSAMQSMREAFDLPIGYSDHTLGRTIAVAAVAMGAEIIEKHFTLDTNFEGPDHKASLMPQELTQLVQEIRAVEKAIGSGKKQPTAKEKETAKLVRKGLYAAKAITKGATISAADIAVMRPEAPVSPMKIDKKIGSKALRNYAKGDPL